MNVRALQKGIYIIAVSGGIDSVSLLHYLYTTQPELKLIIAHFDHGIRQDSADDAQFVKGLAGKYNLLYVTKQEELGSKASEEVARTARYAFLREVKDTYKAEAIITAHHANDVAETMIINLLRGTGWRGLCSLRDTDELKRPFLKVLKEDIRHYAERENLSWREDSTNNDMKYLRNKVRQRIMPQVDISQWREINEKQLVLSQEIDQEIKKLSSKKRYDFIMWPSEVALEILRAELNITRPQAVRTLLAIKTGREGSRVDIGQGRTIRLTRDSFVV